MKFIQKKNEPNSLIECRSTPYASFDNCNKEDIRVSLIKEQGAICAYCMKRISAEWNSELNKYNTEIEHYKSQDVYNGKKGKPDLRLNYNNMLGVCNGNAGFSKHKQHCDKSKDFKGNKKFLPLTINPLNLNCEKLIEFKGNGKITSKDETINRDIQIVLNLNEQQLVKNRKVVIDTAIQSLNEGGKKKNTWNISSIKNELKKWKKLDERGNYQEYCQAVVYILERRLNKNNKS